MTTQSKDDDIRPTTVLRFDILILSILNTAPIIWV